MTTNVGPSTFPPTSMELQHHPSPSPRSSQLLVLVALVALAVNLRPAAVSVGPVLAEIIAGLGMSTTLAGVLTALPLVAFAAFGAAAPWAGRAIGLHRTLLLALLLVTGSLGVRALVSSPWPFLGLSLVALAGMATGNVLLPSLVRLHFPNRIGLATALYTSAMVIGATSASLLTVPIAETFGGWRAGIGAWGLIALIAMLPWLGLVTRDQRADGRRPGLRMSTVARSRLGAAMAVFFGLQSLHGYTIFGWFAQLWRDSGYSAAWAGALVGLLAAVSIPVSLWIPAAAARRTDQRRLLLAVMACYPLGYVGLMVTPYSLAILWALLIGLACCSLPLILTLIALRSRTPEGTAALSGFTQSAGYLLAAAGPVVVGAIYGATGGWTWPLALLLVLTVPQLLVGLYIARPRFIEDELPGERLTPGS